MARDPQIDKLIAEMNLKKFQEGEAKKLTQTYGEEVTKQFTPLFEGHAKTMTEKISGAVSDAIKGLKFEVPKQDAPTITVSPQENPAPIVNVPAPIVKVAAPVVNVPAPIVNIPATKFPEYPDFPSSFKIDGVTPKTPLHVSMVDQAGKPIVFTTGGIGGGRGDFFTIKDIQNSTGGSIIDNDGNVKVAGSFSVVASNSSTQAIDSSGLPYSAANPLPVTFTGSSSTSMSLVNADGTYYNSDNPLPTTATIALPAGQGDAATATRVVIAGNSDASVVVNSGTITTVTTLTGITNTVNVRLDSPDGPYSAANPLPTTATISLPAGQGDAATATRVVIAGNSDASVVVNSGTLTTVTTLTGVTNSVQTVTLDRDGNPFQPFVYGQGDAATAQRVILAGNADASVVVNSGTLTTVTTLTSITNTVAAMNVDSSGVGYSGSNPLPITGTVVVSSITASTASALVDSSGVQYSGSNPFTVGGTVAATKSGTWAIDNPVAQGDAATALRVVIAGNSDASVVVNSGTITTVTTLTGITNSVASALVDSSGVAYSGSNPVPITGTVVVSSVTASTASALVDSSGVQYSGSNPFTIGGTVAATKSGTWAIDNPVAQGDAATALRVVIAGNSDASVVVNSGTITTVTTLTGITNTVATALVDSSGVAYSGSNPVPTSASLSVPQGQGDSATAMRVVIAGNSDASVVVNSGTITTVTTLTGITNTVFTRLDTPDGIVTAANPFPVTLVSGGLTSTLAVGDSAARTADNAGNPVKIGGIARTTQPTVYADGDRVNFGADKYGRMLNRPIQVRDLLATAYVSLTTGTEATFLGASAGKLYDLVWVLLSNQSTAAVQVDVRPITAGNILMTFQVPANGTVGIAPPLPLPGGADTGNNWTVDMPDITGTTVNITGLFSQEI